MKPIISVVIPCYRSADYLKNTVSEILSVFSAQEEYRLQLILVDDCSPDRTADVIRELSAQPQITGLCLPRNIGQSRAKMKGVSYARGAAAVFMDDDGQHDPRAIFTLVRELSPSTHIVYAQFQKQRESLPRRIASRMTNRLLSLTTGKPPGIAITSFFAVDAAALEALRDYRSRRPFIGGYLWHLFGRGCVSCVTVPHRKRTAGTSTYSLRKLIRMFLDLNTSMRDIRRYPRRR